jgi:hypothetical protein
MLSIHPFIGPIDKRMKPIEIAIKRLDGTINTLLTLIQNHHFIVKFFPTYPNPPQKNSLYLEG